MTTPANKVSPQVPSSMARRAGSPGAVPARARSAGATAETYATALILFVALDAVWLGAVAKGFYPQRIGHLLATDVRWGAAALFYLVYAAGVVRFVVTPSLDGAAPSRALTGGASFGLVAYATYDLTNQATLRDWPVLVTVVDLVWGSVLTATVSYLTHRLASWRARSSSAL